jgi:hypothetical protein
MDERLLNWRFVVPCGTQRLLFLPIDSESVPGAIMPERTAESLRSALRDGEYNGVVVGDVAAWSQTVDGGPASLLTGLAASLAPGGWLYAGFPNAWFPARPRRRGSISLRRAKQALQRAGSFDLHPYFALPDQRCPAYLISAKRRTELDYFVRHLFFPHVGSRSPRLALAKQRVLNMARSPVARVPHAVRLACAPAIAVVARRSA